MRRGGSASGRGPRPRGGWGSGWTWAGRSAACTLSPGRRMLSSHRDSARDARLSSRVSREEAAMISEADAVVVGAGALGLSTAFHLARLGVRRVAPGARIALAPRDPSIGPRPLTRLAPLAT